MNCVNFCSKDNVYHKTFGSSCNLARISLKVELRDNDSNSILVIYRLKNTGTVTLCKNYGICSKLLGKFSDELLLVPGEELEIIKPYYFNDEASLEEEASGYVQVTEHDWVASEKVKESITGIGLFFRVNFSPSKFGSTLMLLPEFTNKSMVTGTNVTIRISLSDSDLITMNTLSENNIPNRVPYTATIENNTCVINAPSIPPGGIVTLRIDCTFTLPSTSVSTSVIAIPKIEYYSPDNKFSQLLLHNEPYIIFI